MISELKKQITKNSNDYKEKQLELIKQIAFDQKQSRKVGKINIIIDDEKQPKKESNDMQFMTEPTVEEEELPQKTIDKVKS